MRAIRRIFLSDPSPAACVTLHTDIKAFWTHALPLVGESATNLSGAIQGVTGTGGATTEAGLLESQRQLLALIDNLPGVAYRCSIEPPSIPSFISGGCEALTGYRAEELIGRTMAGLTLTHPEDMAAAAAEVRTAVRAGRPYVTNYRIIQRNGSIRWITESGRAIYVAGKPVHLEGFMSDFTDPKRAEAELKWAAMHDPLTKLPNRALFQQWLDEALARAGGSGAHVGLLLLDLDDFKQVNDSLGHDAGDKLLCTLAERLQSVTSDGDLVARLGGDEFAMILSSVGGEDDVIAAAERTLTCLKEPCNYDGRLLDCRATIGASVYPHHGLHRTELLKQADVALYIAKSSGRGRMKIFEPAMRAKMQNRTSMLSLAREAIRCDLIEPFYQPKIDLRTGKVAGFEALLRWRHEHRGMQPPSTIAAAFEDADLACAISDRMIDRAVADMRRWLDQGVDFGHVAVNASAAEFRSGDFADRLLRRLAGASVPTSRFQLEITETVFLGRGAEYVEQALKQLSDAGVEIALDDFGTGYASLTHLKQFPVDVIKVDRSFVGDLENDADAAPIIRALINLGQSLNIKIVAEGIETEAQHQFLVAQGCDYGQGYFYGKAAPASQVPTSRSLYRLPRPRPSPPEPARCC